MGLKVQPLSKALKHL